MKTHFSQLSRGDFWILFLLAVMWSILFGIFYYFVPNILILAIGLLCTVVSGSGYILVGGVRGMNSDLPHPTNVVDGAGWNTVRGSGARRAA